MGLRSASSAISDHCCVDRKVFMTKDFADFLIKQILLILPFTFVKYTKEFQRFENGRTKEKMISRTNRLELS